MRTDASLRFSSGYKPPGLNLPGRHFTDGVSQSGHERNHLFLATAGRFTDVAGVSGADSIADGRAVALLDYDRDGWQDLALVNANAPKLELYRNQMVRLYDGSPPGFVAVRFEGGNRSARPSKLSNRDGYGAVVTVELEDGVRLVREHRAGEGMATQNSATMLIGLGRAKAVGELAVRWPSGAQTKVENVASGTLVRAMEVAEDGAGHFVRTPYVQAAGRRGSLRARPDRRQQLDAAYEGLLGYFSERVRTADPSWLSLFGFMKRRFGAEVRLASGDLAHAIRDGVARPEIYAIMRRIDDPSAAVEKRQIAELAHVVDRITASALHCDRIEVPADWVEILGKAARAGGYALTHSVLAAEWTVENGCRRRSEIDSLRREQHALLVELIEKRASLQGRFEADVDLWIEAIAMLYYSGGRSLVRVEWIDEVLERQNADGGWPRSTSQPGSDPHASALAAWVLLENLRAAAALPWISPSAPQQSK